MSGLADASGSFRLPSMLTCSNRHRPTSVHGWFRMLAPFVQVHGFGITTLTRCGRSVRVEVQEGMTDERVRRYSTRG